MKTRFILTALLTLVASLTFSQSIEIGQSAEQVKAIIEYTTKQHNRTDSYGNRASSRWQWDARYKNGKIAEVVQCYTNQYIVDFKIMANLCKHYLMENEKLASILTQYENVSIETLREKFNNVAGDRRIGEYYFSEDFTSYSRIFLHSNGLATVEWRDSDKANLPKNIYASIAQKLKAIETEKSLKMEEAARREAERKALEAAKIELEEKKSEFRQNTKYYTRSELTNNYAVELLVMPDVVSGLQTFLAAYKAGSINIEGFNADLTNEVLCNYKFFFNKAGRLDKVSLNIESADGLGHKEGELPYSYKQILSKNIRLSEVGKVYKYDENFPVNAVFDVFFGTDVQNKQLQMMISKNKKGEIQIVKGSVVSKEGYEDEINLLNILKTKENIVSLSKGKYMLDLVESKGEAYARYSQNNGEEEVVKLPVNDVEVKGVKVL